jgi:hypothetical protein
MDAPEKDSITMIDANCCIHYSIRLETYNVMGRWTKTLEYYVNKSKEKGACIGYTDYLREESERNLVKQLNELSRETALQRSNLIFMKCKDRCAERMQKLFERLTPVALTCTLEDVGKARDFYRKNAEKKKTGKTEIPSENDLKLLAGTKNHKHHKTKRILTDDNHYISYSAEILKEYDLGIQALAELENDLHRWRWKR